MRTVRHTRRLLASIAGLAIATAALVGCSTGDGAGAAAAGTAAAGAAASELSKGTLVIGLSRQLTTLDPGKSGSVDGDGSTPRAIYASLTYYDPQEQLKGDLATSWKQTGPPQWTFTLRKGA